MKKTHKRGPHKANVMTRAFDGKGKPIRGLWQRNAKYYAQITLSRPDGSKVVSKVPLKARTLTEAREARRKLLVERTEGEARFYGQAPKFAEYIQVYLRHQTGRKSPGTMVGERGHINFWKSQFGGLRLNQITPTHVREGLSVMAENGNSQRTRNLAITMLRNVLKMAISDRLLRQLPIDAGMTQKPRRKERTLYTPDKLESLCEAVLRVSANGVQFCEFVRLLAYSGGRMSETLRLAWADVHWEQQTLCFGADGLAKGKEPRLVNFNPQLKTHLEEMYANRRSEEWLFTSAQRGREGQRAKSFRSTLILARNEAGQDGPRGVAVAFHDLRHMFASYCVMSSVDTMTIARWMGHKDGGKLIRDVYGHLSAEHLHRAAQQVHFGPRIIDCSGAREVRGSFVPAVSVQANRGG